MVLETEAFLKTEHTYDVVCMSIIPLMCTGRWITTS